jgi:hypothetical protein
MKDNKKRKKKLGQPFYVNNYYIMNKIVPSILIIIKSSFRNVYLLINKTNPRNM